MPAFENNFRKQNHESGLNFIDNDESDFSEVYHYEQPVNECIDNIINTVDYETGAITTIDHNTIDTHDLLDQFYKSIVEYDDELDNRQRGVIKTFIDYVINAYNIITLEAFNTIDDKLNILPTIINDLELNPDKSTWQICNDLLSML